jgi:hypothetical protein
MENTERAPGSFLMRDANSEASKSAEGIYVLASRKIRFKGGEHLKVQPLESCYFREDGARTKRSKDFYIR